jgi:hypothetical protein
VIKLYLENKRDTINSEDLAKQGYGKHMPRKTGLKVQAQ